jgi:hypothetical protein
MPSDVQEIEGMNFLVTRCVRESPHTTLSLLSARVMAAKRLGFPLDGVSKWSSIRPAFDAALDEAVEHFPLAAAVVAEEGRFACPPPLAAGPPPRANAQPAAVQWAIKWNLQWFRAFGREADIRRVFAIHVHDPRPTAPAPREAWLCATTHFYKGFLIRCRLHDCPGGGGRGQAGH